MKAETILQHVSELFEVSIEAIKSPSQYSEDVTPRHIYFDLCMLFQYELEDKIETCAWLVNRDVTTLRAGAKRAQAISREDIIIKMQMQRIQSKIQKYILRSQRNKTI